MKINYVIEECETDPSTSFLSTLKIIRGILRKFEREKSEILDQVSGLSDNVRELQHEIELIKKGIVQDHPEHGFRQNTTESITEKERVRKEFEDLFST